MYSYCCLFFKFQAWEIIEVKALALRGANPASIWASLVASLKVPLHHWADLGNSQDCRAQETPHSLASYWTADLDSWELQAGTHSTPGHHLRDFHTPRKGLLPSKIITLSSSGLVPPADHRSQRARSINNVLHPSRDLGGEKVSLQELEKGPEQ